MSLTIIQQLTLCKAGPHGIISQLLCDVCNLLAIGLECTGALGASMRGAMIAYMPNGGMCATPWPLLAHEGNAPAPDGIYFNLGYSAPRLGATRSA